MSSLMVQGTTSDAGKSALVCGLARCLQRRGIKVAPFKPQNMALNSAVTDDGGEIGRAQAVQAQAACIKPTTDMNPVLIKPNSDTAAQIIVHGKALSNTDAAGYQRQKRHLLPEVMQSWKRLNAIYECILVEGAGSPAEINLRENDIANMGFAEVADCPVIIIADIDRGGVFAHLVGTLELLSESEKDRVKGFVINKFRGDIRLLEPGLQWLENKTAKPVLGVLPYLQNFHLEAEDGFSGFVNNSNQSLERLRVVIPVLPRISNHTDFDPLALRPDIDLILTKEVAELRGADCLILPGTKNVRQDLDWLRTHGWAEAIAKHLRYGGKVMGICGGFQMLGNVIKDPNGIEGKAGESVGLAYLDMQTTLQAHKQLNNVKGHLNLQNQSCEGYEIHAGITQGPALAYPAIRLSQGNDGAISEDGQIFGTYLHGIFNSSESCDGLLQWMGLEKPEVFDYQAVREQGINDMADCCEEYLDMKKVLHLLFKSSLHKHKP